MTLYLVSKGWKVTVDEAIEELQQARGNFRCSRLVRILESLGFVVESCSAPNHKKFKHRDLPGFSGSNFSCAHGKNPMVKPRYIGNVRKVLEDWKDELEELS